MRIKDMTGKRFGKLLVIKYSHQNPKTFRTYWLCKCECGNKTIVSQSHLHIGKTKSCGCLIKQNGKRKHNLCKSRIYRIYSRMKNVCYYKNSKDYMKYGGRGIDICEEWLGENGLMNFYNWSIKNGYDEDLSPQECSIDRIDNNKGYSPNNCRWTTLKVQQNNTRRNHFICYNGINQTVAQWAEKLNMKYSTLHERLRKG